MYSRYHVVLGRGLGLPMPHYLLHTVSKIINTYGMILSLPTRDLRTTALRNVLVLYYVIVYGNLAKRPRLNCVLGILLPERILNFVMFVS